MARYGLINLESELHCPLKSVNIKATFVDRFGSATIIQEFENNSSSPIEAVFTFPKDSQAAVTSFKVTTNNKTLIGELNASESAQEKYSDAIAEGKGAYLLQQKRADIVTLYIGSLLPHQKVGIELGYVIESQWEGDALRITFPTTIAPRYTPQQLQQDEEHQINPEYHSNDKLPYEFMFNASVRLTYDTISSFESPSHEFDLRLSDDRKQIEIEAKAANGDILNNRDIILIVHSTEREQRKQPLMIDEVDPNGHHALYLSFIPNIVNQGKHVPKQPHEIVFLVDRSGSMSGAPMENCKSALLLFLRSLPTDSYFNIVSFGSTFKSLYNYPEAYNNTSLDNASKHVKYFTADLGGTEMMAPLTKILGEKPRKDCKRVVFVLTDGEVSNANQVIDLVRKHSSTTSVFTFGIGNNVSRQLLNGMAEAGNGYAEYANSNERLQPKIIRQLKSALSSFQVSVDWQSDKVKMFPRSLLPTNEDEPVHFMAFIDDPNYLNKVREIDLTLQGDGKAFKTSVNLNSLKTIEGTTMHQLFVKSKTDALAVNAKDTKRKKMQDLCLKYHVLSNLTSFLVVEQRKNSTEKTSKLVNVPLAIPTTKITKFSNGGKVQFNGDTSFCESFVATIGVDFKMTTVNLGAAGTAKSQAWDTAGQERFRSMSTSYYRGANGVLLVYDITSKNSFQALDRYYEEAMRSVAQNTAFVVAGNKTDLQHNRQVTTDEGLNWANAHNIPFFEVSAKDLSNMSELVQSLYSAMYMKQWESGAGSVNFKFISVGESGAGKSAITDRMSGFSIDLSDLTARYPLLGSNANGNHVAYQSNSAKRNPSPAQPGMFGKLWGNITGIFSRNKPSKSIKNSAATPSMINNNNNARSISTQVTQNVIPTAISTSKNVASTNAVPNNNNNSARISKKSMDPILLLQEASGSWKSHQHLAKLLNIEWTEYTGTKPDGVEDDVWMTLICIAYLSLVCSEHKSEWELIVQKAEAWLKSVNGNKSEWSQKARNTIQQYM